jgi:hypothetical protein
MPVQSRYIRLSGRPGPLVESQQFLSMARAVFTQRTERIKTTSIALDDSDRQSHSQLTASSKLAHRGYSPHPSDCHTQQNQLPLVEAEGDSTKTRYLAVAPTRDMPHPMQATSRPPLQRRLNGHSVPLLPPSTDHIILLAVLLLLTILTRDIFRTLLVWDVGSKKKSLLRDPLLATIARKQRCVGAKPSKRNSSKFNGHLSLYRRKGKSSHSLLCKVFITLLTRRVRVRLQCRSRRSAIFSWPLCCRL